MQKARRRPCRVAPRRSMNGNPGRHISDPYPNTQRSDAIRAPDRTRSLEVSVPDPTPPRKLSRLGLYGPFGLLLVLIAVWTVVWLRARAELAHRLDGVATAMQHAGYEVNWR